MNFGMCYYPEYYKLSEADKMISEDIDMLKEMNMDVVRIAEFTWCLIEPEEGVYEFDWLDKIVNKLGSAGIKSIIWQLNSDNFPRLKIGVGDRKDPDSDLKDYVLGRFSKDDLDTIKETMKRAVKAVELMVQGDAAGAMNKYNG